MYFRVPLLLQKSVALVERLDISATRTYDPPGEDTSGYDETFREGIIYESAGVRQETLKFLDAVRVPCQVEIIDEQELRQAGFGDSPMSDIRLVFHRKDLRDLGLIDANGNTLIKKSDRVVQLEQYNSPGTIVKKWDDPGLYIFEVQSGSWGFGPDGHDLEIVYLEDRKRG